MIPFTSASRTTKLIEILSRTLVQGMERRGNRKLFNELKVSVLQDEKKDSGDEKDFRAPSYNKVRIVNNIVLQCTLKS
jgi:hypothetical protein